MKIKSIPVMIPAKIAENDNYVCAICKCPQPLNFGHIFLKSDFPRGQFIQFECANEPNEQYSVWNQ